MKSRFRAKVLCYIRKSDYGLIMVSYDYGLVIESDYGLGLPWDWDRHVRTVPETYHKTWKFQFIVFSLLLRFEKRRNMSTLKLNVWHKLF
jgi:hypothetical protein